jgi:PAS domain S-box-containing protein
MSSDVPLRILHLEDDADYCKLVRDLLAGDGCDADVVDVCGRQAFEAAVRQGRFDVILGDFSLPGYTGLEALKFTRQHAPQTPFLLVSGTIGEHAAIESLRAGAADYVLKQWPERLLPAMRRAVDEARERKQRQQAEAELVRKEYYFRALTGNALDIVSLLDNTGSFLYTNPAVQRTLGVAPEELTGTSFFNLVHAEDLTRIRDAFEFGLNNSEQTLILEMRLRHRDGRWIPLEAVGQNHLDDSQIGAFVFNLRDASERKRIERRQQALYYLGRSLSSVSAPLEAATIIREVADQLFTWDVFSLDLHSEDRTLTRPVLNVDTFDGQRKVVETPGGMHPTSILARRISEKGAELILAPDPVRFLPDARPFGDTNRPSASLMFAPIRNRKKVIGILSVQSYQPNALDEHDLESLQVLADHCGGALERIAAEHAWRENERRRAGMSSFCCSAPSSK